jgi:Fe-Mn family superoxide dismutase
MKKFEEKKFNIGKLVGISEKTTEEHLKLYSSYVKNANALLERNAELSLDLEKNSYLIGELFRRFSFEYNGMRNHEIYFDSLSGGGKELDQNGPLHKTLLENFGLMEHFFGAFKFLALTRGVGWAMLWWDKKDQRLLMSWVDEQHLGQLQDCTLVLALDMWEHSFVADYQPSGKKKYIDDFFVNLNWQKVEKNFTNAK